MTEKKETPGMVEETVATDNQIARINLTINQEILKILLVERLDINHLFILLAMYNEEISLLDMYDMANTSTQVLIYQYQNLYMKGFLEDTSSEKMYQISEKGVLFVEKVSALFEQNEEGKDYDNKFKVMCENYLSLFPKVKLPSGKYARVNIIEVEKKMKAFIKAFKPRFKKDYGFVLTHEDILKATKSYVDRYARDNYKFMATSSYFIHKGEASALADEILAIKDGLEKTKSNITIQ